MISKNSIVLLIVLNTVAIAGGPQDAPVLVPSRVSVALEAAKNFAGNNPWTSVGVAAATVAATHGVAKKISFSRLINELESVLRDLDMNDQKTEQFKIQLLSGNARRKNIILGIDPIEYGIKQEDYKQFLNYLRVYDAPISERDKALKNKWQEFRSCIATQKKSYENNLMYIAQLWADKNNSAKKGLIQFSADEKRGKEDEKQKFIDIMSTVYEPFLLQHKCTQYAGDYVGKDIMEADIRLIRTRLYSEIEYLNKDSFAAVREHPERYGVSKKLCDEIEQLNNMQSVGSLLRPLISEIENQARIKQNSLNEDLAVKTAAAGSVGLLGYGLQKLWQWWQTPNAQRPNMTWASIPFRYIARKMEEHPKITLGIGIAVAGFTAAMWWLKRKFNEPSKPKKHNPQKKLSPIMPGGDDTIALNISSKPTQIVTQSGSEEDPVMVVSAPQVDRVIDLTGVQLEDDSQQ